MLNVDHTTESRGLRRIHMVNKNKYQKKAEEYSKKEPDLMYAEESAVFNFAKHLDEQEKPKQEECSRFCRPEQFCHLEGCPNSPKSKPKKIEELGIHLGWTAKNSDNVSDVHIVNCMKAALPMLVDKINELIKAHNGQE